MHKLGHFSDRLQFRSPWPGAGTILGWCAAALERWRQREALAALDDRALADIGVTREQAAMEASKPFWR